MTKKKRNEYNIVNVMRPNGKYYRKVTEDTPLTPGEQKFLTEYIRSCDVTKARKVSRIRKSTAAEILCRPNVQAEIQRIMDELRKESVAAAEEVMEYFTSVMRGEVKDQFGLDAPLSERTRAAQELAKRTIDIDNKKAGIPDQNIAVKLDWGQED